MRNKTQKTITFVNEHGTFFNQEPSFLKQVK
jgi:hypothetical protein